MNIRDIQPDRPTVVVEGQPYGEQPVRIERNWPRVKEWTTLDGMIQEISELMCDSCQWPQVYTDVIAEKCDNCQIQKKLLEIRDKVIEQYRALEEENAKLRHDHELDLKALDSMGAKLKAVQDALKIKT